MVYRRPTRRARGAHRATDPADAPLLHAGPSGEVRLVELRGLGGLPSVAPQTIRVRVPRSGTRQVTAIP